MNVLLPKKIDKTRVLGQVLDSSFQFENGLQSNSPWKTNKKERRATVCPEVQKSPKLGKGGSKLKKNDRKSLPVGPKIKLDGPLKRRKKSAKQIEKAEKEYAFFDSSQDETEEIDEFGDVEGKKLKTNTTKIKTPAKVKPPTKSKTPAKNKPSKNTKTESSPSVKGKARGRQNKAKTSPPTSPSKKVKATVKKASQKNSPERKTVKKASPAKKTSAKKKTPAATKKPTKKPAAVGTRRSTRNIELSK